MSDFLRPFVGPLILVAILALLAVLTLGILRIGEWASHNSDSFSTPKSTPGATKRDRIPVNMVCDLGPAGVFDTNDDVTLFMVATINGARSKKVGKVLPVA